MPLSWLDTLDKKLNIKDYILTLKNILKFAEDNQIYSIRYSYLDFYDSTIKRLSKLPTKFYSD